MNGKMALLAVVALCCLGAGCARSEAPDPEGNEAPLTHEAALGQLRSVAERLQNHDYRSMDEVFAIPPGATAAELFAQLPSLVQDQEISAGGVEVLAREGRWGPLSALEDAERLSTYAARFGFAASDCLGLQRPPAEVVFCRDAEGRYRIVRLDDVGKL